jgi:flagellar biosynthesis protein FlhF
MGPGAVILKTNRTVRRRLFGLLPKMAYEITAAADPAADASAGPADAGAALLGEQELSPAAVGTRVLPGLEDTRPPETKPKTVSDRGLETYEVAETPPPPAAPERRPAAGGRLNEDRRWADELNRLSDEIQGLVRLVSHQQKHDTLTSLFLSHQGVAQQLQELIWNDAAVSLETRKAAYGEFLYLIREGLDENFAYLVLREAFRNFPADEEIHDRLRLRINRTIGRMAPARPIDLERDPKAHIFVGPTGVGKTTTIAKLAARFALKDRRPVKLLTIDTYRIAAAEQLRTYGDIIGIPVRIVFTLDELETAICESAANEVLLIDTTGHSHRKIAEYGELSRFAREHSQLQKHLVLSCTTRQEALREIVSCFSVFEPDRLVFTKLDECSSFGAIFNEVVRLGKPLSYLTNGQDVAEDLIVPNASTLADLLMPLN